MASTRNVPEKMFDQLISNIQNFARLKSTSTDLGVNYIVHKQNCDDLVSFSKILKDAGVDNVRFLLCGFLIIRIITLTFNQRFKHN